MVHHVSLTVEASPGAATAAWRATLMLNPPGPGTNSTNSCFLSSPTTHFYFQLSSLPLFMVFSETRYHACPVSQANLRFSASVLLLQPLKCGAIGVSCCAQIFLFFLSLRLPNPPATSWMLLRVFLFSKYGTILHPAGQSVCSF